jgi:hypothetical protein
MLMQGKKTQNQIEKGKLFSENIQYNFEVVVLSELVPSMKGLERV